MLRKCCLVSLSEEGCDVPCGGNTCVRSSIQACASVLHTDHESVLVKQPHGTPRERKSKCTSRCVDLPHCFDQRLPGPSPCAYFPWEPRFCRHSFSVLGEFGEHNYHKQGGAAVPKIKRLHFHHVSDILQPLWDFVAPCWVQASAFSVP